jgi:hypothetical protein
MAKKKKKTKAPKPKIAPKPKVKVPADMYTALLAIALVAIIVGSVMLYLETADYGTSKRRGAPSVVWNMADSPDVAYDRIV